MVLAQGFPWNGSRIVGWGFSHLKVDFGFEWEAKWKYLVFKSVVQKKYGFIHILEFSSVQLLSRVRLFATPWIATRQASVSITIPGVHSDSCPSSQWCHPATSSSVLPFSSGPQSLPASQSFPLSQPFTWGGQSTGVSALVSVLPKNTQDWSPLGWTGCISLQSKGLFKSFLQHHSSKASIL